MIANKKLEEDFSDYLCLDPLDILCTIPMKFYPPKIPTDIDIFPTFFHDVNDSTSLKLRKLSKTDSSYVNDILSANLEIHLRKLETLDRRDIENSLFKYDPYYILNYKSPLTPDLPSKDSLGIYAISAAYGLPKNVERYACIGDGPGGWVSFIQKKYSHSQGYGITLANGSDWEIDRIDLKKFQLIYGESFSGDILRESQYFIDFIFQKGTYLDLVTCDASGSIELVIKQVSVALKLLRPRVLETYLREGLLQPLSLEELGYKPDDIGTVYLEGGCLILRLGESTSKIIGDLIYLLSRCFENISIYKPSVVNAHEGVSYLICKDFLGANGIIEVINMMDKSTVLAAVLSTRFRSFLETVNNALVARQDRVVRHIIAGLSDTAETKKDNSRMMLLLGIPGSSGIGVF